MAQFCARFSFSLFWGKHLTSLQAKAYIFLFGSYDFSHDRENTVICNALFKDVPAKIFQSIDFLKIFLLQSVNELVVSEMQNKQTKTILGVTDFVSDVKRVENYPDF